MYVVLVRTYSGPPHLYCMQGTKDTTVHPKYSPRIIDLLPEKTRSTARLVSVDDAGHEVITTHSEIVAEELVRFFNEK